MPGDMMPMGMEISSQKFSPNKFSVDAPETKSDSPGWKFTSMLRQAVRMESFFGVHQLLLV
jgi:hypothetical protein